MSVAPLNPMVSSLSDPPPAALVVIAPQGHWTGLIVACPHSGRYYPPELLDLSVLDRLNLRRSEDAFVDALFSPEGRYSAAFLANIYARAYVDVNRDAQELDPELIKDLPLQHHRVTPRVEAGLGVIPRSVGDGVMIYRRGLTWAQAQARLARVHRPWHEALEQQIDHAIQQCGRALLLDCHSMPAAASGQPEADVVLGDRFGGACAPIISHEAHSFLAAAGLRTVRNTPYAGGYTTQIYGRPGHASHCLQIEINRSLYMVEGAMTKRSQFDAISDTLRGFAAHMADVIAHI